MSPRELHYPASSAESPYDVWLMPFGNWLHQKKQGSLPSFTNTVAGTLLKSEAGVRFYETIKTEHSRSFSSKSSVTSTKRLSAWAIKPSRLWAPTIPFPVAIGGTHTQNLGGAEVHCWFIPLDSKSIYGSVDAEVEIGASFQSYLAFFTVGRRF